MKDFIFDLQRFTDVTLSAGETQTIDGITYTALDDNVTLTIGDTGATVKGGKVSLQMDGFGKSFGFDVTDGSISYDSNAGKFSIAKGTKSYIGNGKFPDQFIAKNDFDISVTKSDDGKFKFSLGDESIAFDLTRNGKVIMGSTITLDGSIIVDPTNHEISLPKNTVVTMTPGTGKTLQIKALDDAGGELTLVNGGIRFKPNENDGALEFNFVDSDRKVTLDVTGAFTYKGLGALSLEDGTVANFSWEDGNKLKLTSHGSTGSIGIDPTRGLKITSDDENLDMTFSTPSMSTDISGIKGTIYYNAGVVSFDENSKITATTTLGGQPMLTTLEAIGGTGHISFNTTNGVIYSADTGAMKITWARGDLESTFTVNKGSVQIGHNLFKIAEGTDLVTDLKNFVPALYFTTDKAGMYTINGQTITTSAEGLKLTATDDYMTFKTSGDVVEYDGMTFAGNGNVSLSSDNVVLGTGVVANGFGEGNSFVLAEAGNVTADAKVFQLDPLSLNDGREIPMIITVTGAQDGFIFSRTLTEESEEYLGEKNSPYVGQVFTEKFIAAGDSSYRIRTDPIGLEDVIGISDGASVSGGATLDDENTLSYYMLVTDTTGDFTIGEKTYTLAKGSKIGTGIRARFDAGKSYADRIDSLSGTVSGDFREGNFKINGSEAMKIFGDTDVSVVADKKGFEIFGLDTGASLQVSAADTYKVNGTEIAADASAVIVGTSRGTARLYNENYIENTLSDVLITGTALDDTVDNSGTAVTIQALGGNDYIENNVDSSLVAAELANFIDAGDGNDTVYSYHTYNPTILGGVGDDSIVVERGHKTFADGGTGNDSIIGISNVGGWGMGDYATILGGEGDDYINPIYSGSASIDGGNGNDTIFANGANATIDGGAGNNLIGLTDDEGGVKGKFVVLNGNTTVESFNTGFESDLDPEMGEGTDTVYIKGESPAVDFKADGLTLYYDNDSTKSLTFADTKKTAKLNLYYEASLKSVAEVFIADNDWYSVTENDLSVRDDSELWFVGATAKMNHGIDFSGISEALNISLNTDYEADVENFRINNIHSIKGGADLTTITGSDKDDTIIAGTGATTINAAAGDDFISLGSASALIEYGSGDGNDKIIGMSANSTLNISGSAYIVKKRGNNLILKVGKDQITLQGAAGLSNLNIIGTPLTEEILKAVTDNCDYGTPITDQSEVATLLAGDLNDNMALLLENKSVDFSKFDGRKNVTLSGSGKQDVIFNDAGYNVSVVDADANGKKNISLGGGNDLAVVEDARAKVSITASKGEDSIFSEGRNVTLNLGEGNTKIFALDGRITLENYNAETGMGFVTDYSDILSAINDGEIYFDKGKLSIDSAVADFNGVNSWVVNFFNSAGKLQKVGQAAPNESLDLSKETANFILTADKNSTLTSGTGDDTIFAYAGSLVNAGAGKNSVYIEDRNENEQSATIVLDSSGTNTITNFRAGFDNDSDKLFFGVNDTVGFKFDGTNLTVQNNDNSSCGLLTNIAADTPFVNILAADDNAPVKIVVAQEDAVVTVDDELADFYSGENSGVDFTGYEGKLMINLGSTEMSIGGGEVLFSGINQITAGSGRNTVIGSDANETLIAGKGDTSIYGAGGSNVLQGYTGDDKEGKTTFFVLGVAEKGTDTIQNFAFVNDDKSADMIEIDTAANFVRQESIAVKGNDVAFSVENRSTGVTESVLVKNAASTSENVKDMRFSDGLIVQVSANDLCFDKFANFYVATGKNATLTVNEGAEIWLDGSHGKTFVGDIKTLDAAALTDTAQLAGNDLDNTILAGNGDASLWGGNGGDDLLVGGESKNVFFYTNGNGNDTITGVNDGDIVCLSQITLENLAGTEFNGNSVAINFKDGGKLTVNDAENCSFVMGDQTFYVNSEHTDFVTEK